MKLPFLFLPSFWFGFIFKIILLTGTLLKNEAAVFYFHRANTVLLVLWSRTGTVLVPFRNPSGTIRETFQRRLRSRTDPEAFRSGSS